jgi:hypothetical protein
MSLTDLKKPKIGFRNRASVPRLRFPSPTFPARGKKKREINSITSCPGAISLNVLIAALK